MNIRLLITSLSFLAISPLFGQEAGAEVASQPDELNLINLLEKGGIVMIVLSVISVFTLMLALLYLFTLRRGTVVTNKFMNASEAMLRKKDYLGLIAFCHRRNEAVARVTQKSLDFLTKNETASSAEIREVAEAEASRQGALMTQRISYLADIGAIAPMVGLLGTVVGMIRSFMQISRGEFEGVKQIQLATGVWEALITTAGGLAIGIFAMICYAYFRGRVQRHLAELEAAGTHILAIISNQLRSPNSSEETSS